MTTAAHAALFGLTAVNPTPPTSLPVPAAPDRWPAPPNPDAYTGLAGAVVAALAPHTEADPVAILASLLVGFGSLVGPEPAYHVGASMHRTSEFAVFVGPSGAGRKGSSRDAVDTVLGAVDAAWAAGRVASGLSSGGGLIWHLRDRDDGVVPDRRLLVLESELASVLKAAPATPTPSHRSSATPGTTMSSKSSPNTTRPGPATPTCRSSPTVKQSHLLLFTENSHPSPGHRLVTDVLGQGVTNRPQAGRGLLSNRT
jgi:hypothetical protein